MTPTKSRATIKTTTAGEKAEPPAALKSSSSSWMSAAGVFEAERALEAVELDELAELRDGPEGWDGCERCGDGAALGRAPCEPPGRPLGGGP